ncbi:hypothetical protein [Oceanimonas smirnovii]|uniref:Uncharacterized protein n=1 Tax=Oceanimonas smirnovii TaxID=264574 RepID=A0ABW7NXD8_9GAMM
MELSISFIKMLAGIVVAVTVEAASNSFKLHINPDTLKRVTQELG